MYDSSLFVHTSRIAGFFPVYPGGLGSDGFFLLMDVFRPHLFLVVDHSLRLFYKGIATNGFINVSYSFPDQIFLFLGNRVDLDVYKRQLQGMG